MLVRETDDVDLDVKVQNELMQRGWSPRIDEGEGKPEETWFGSVRFPGQQEPTWYETTISKRLPPGSS